MGLDRTGGLDTLFLRFLAEMDDRCESYEVTSVGWHSGTRFPDGIRPGGAVERDGTTAGLAALPRRDETCISSRINRRGGATIYVCSAVVEMCLFVRGKYV